MTEQKRITIMVGLLIALVIANVLFRMGGGEGDNTFWSGVTDLSEGYSPRLLKKMKDIENLPELAFVTGGEAETVKEIKRNPFIFGIDRQKEAEQKQRMEALRTAREEEMARIAEEEALPVEPVEAPVRFNGKILGLMQDTQTGKIMLSVMIEDEVHIVSKDDVLVERYRLVDIRNDKAYFVSLPEEKELNIPLNLD